MSTQNQLRGTEEAVQVGATLRRQVHTLPVAADLAYFQIEHTVEDLPESMPTNFREYFKRNVVSGFARPDDIIAFLDDEAPAIQAVANMRVVPPGFREMAQRNRFMDALEVHQPAIVAKSDYFDDLRAGRIDLDDIVQLDIGSHMLFDRQGQVLPTGLHFDYTNGMFHSGRYYLDLALQVLLQDSRVSPVPVRRGDAEPTLRISRVGAMFSTDDYNQQHIYFMFSPTVEDMRAIWEKCKSYGSEYPSTMMRQAMFDLDILKLRAAGAAKYNDFWSADEVQSDD